MTAQPPFVKALALTLALVQPPPSLVPVAAMLAITAQPALRHVKGPVTLLVATRFLFLVSVKCVQLVHMGRLLLVLRLVRLTVERNLLVKTTVTAQEPTVLLLVWAARV
jgi:hypothetical protein